MKKKPTLYIAVLVLWSCCLGLLAYTFTRVIGGLDEYVGAVKGFIIALLAVNTVVLGILWLGSVKDFVFSLGYAITYKKLNKVYADVEKVQFDEKTAPRVLLLYCTCNDFNAKALSECRKQKYPNYKTVILDDSKNADYISEIDEYVSKNPEVELIRRTDKSGYKAGNLNNYLKGRSDYDYFVVLDSDEIIPHDYIVETLKYFYYDKNCGAVQARHEATKGGNVFQRLMGLCVASNGKTVQVVKNFYGANALIGHGMIISRNCYEKTGGFPLVVAEDISFAVEIKNAGLNIIYAPDVLCFEEFPIDYISLKKRQCKWTQGNLEYMRKYDKEINTCKMSWFEKFDIKLSHYSLPIVPLLSFLLAVCTITLGFLGYPVIRYSLAVYGIMILFLCSPLLPDMFVHKCSSNVFLLIPYFIVNILTYASLSPMMLKTITLGIFGKKARFVVTPKEARKISVKEALKYSWDSLLFAAIIGTASFLACGSVLPVIFITAGCLCAPLIILLANITLKEKNEAEKVVTLKEGAKMKKQLEAISAARFEAAATKAR